MKIPCHKRLFALYKGDQFLSEGTIREINRETGKSINFLKHMLTPTYSRRCGDSIKRLRLISLDDE